MQSLVATRTELLDRRGRALFVAEGRDLLEDAAFEATYLDQNDQRRTLAETLDVGWRLLDPFPRAELKRLSVDELATHHRPSDPADSSSTSAGARHSGDALPTELAP